MPFVEAAAYLLGFQSWAQDESWSYRRMPGTGGVKRNDIIVFMHPENEKYIVKRCIGLPGDTLQISHNCRYINGIIQPESQEAKFSYNVKSKAENLPVDSLKEYGITNKDFLWRYKSYFHMSMTDSAAVSLKNCSLIDTVAIDDMPVGTNGPALFPPHYDVKFTRENYGPVIIPAKNKTILLNTSNVAFYIDVITKYESNLLNISGNKIYINDKETDRYTFKMNYYFMAGDNRYHSIDSRYWGFVPENLLIGKVSFMFFSLDPEQSGFKKFRMNRMFKSIN
ncbi:hypothetical protein A3860_04940 [Niastella vici]|uniref:Signal peptidase I n=2 Tax=Niastella vici TaxID=1703345 RepID=A0A1V9FS32_9BACT|nr:hypothetical protein A3860_04940 [Niastella vici]